MGRAIIFLEVSMETSLETIVEQQGSLLWEVNAVVISDEPTMKHAQSLLSDCNTLKKGITKFCADNVESAHRAHKAAKAMEKALLAPVGATEDIVRGKLKVFAADQEKIRQTAMKKIRDEQIAEAAKVPKAAGGAPAPAPPPPPVKVESVIDAGKFREVWEWEVEDLEKIPEDYWILDEALIAREVRAKKGACKIPGIKITMKKTPIA